MVAVKAMVANLTEGPVCGQLLVVTGGEDYFKITRFSVVLSDEHVVRSMKLVTGFKKKIMTDEKCERLWMSLPAVKELLVHVICFRGCSDANGAPALA